MQSGNYDIVLAPVRNTANLPARKQRGCRDAEIAEFQNVRNVFRIAGVFCVKSFDGANYTIPDKTTLRLRFIEISCRSQNAIDSHGLLLSGHNGSHESPAPFASQTPGLRL